MRAHTSADIEFHPSNQSNLNPSRQGDLIAVDLMAHDIIGLGFEVCGSRRDGIFVRSLNDHGPARASGCLEPGDRLKCVNISFEDITLEDARDLLTCGSPYKLRLLIEKRVASASELQKLAKSSNNSYRDSEKMHLSSVSNQLRPLDRSPAGTQHSQMSDLTLGPMLCSPSTAILNHHRSTDNHSFQAIEPSYQTGGPLTATKNYLRKISARLLGAGMPEDGTTGNRSRFYHQEGNGLPPNVAPIGSSLARRRLQLERGFEFQHQLDESSPATSSSQINEDAPRSSASQRSKFSPGGHANRAFEESLASHINDEPEDGDPKGKEFVTYTQDQDNSSLQRTASQPTVVSDHQHMPAKRGSDTTLILRSVHEFTPVSKLISAPAIEDISSPRLQQPKEENSNGISRSSGEDCPGGIERNRKTN